MIKEISKSDIITRPIKVYKEWTLDENDIKPIFAKSGSFGDYDSEIYEKSNGFSKVILFRSIKAQFYTNAETASVLFEVGRRNPLYNAYASTNERVLVIANFDQTIIFNQKIKLPTQIRDEFDRREKSVILKNALTGAITQVNDFKDGLNISLKPSEAIIYSF
jgi:hypothetical protein